MRLNLKQHKPKLRTLGIAGLLFFTAKGLAWLVVPLLLATRTCSP